MSNEEPAEHAHNEIITGGNGRDGDLANEENLSFTLLSNPDLAVHNSYGTYREKSMYGKTVMGVIRSTFVIDEKGVLTHALYNVRATGHVASLKAKLGL